MTFSLKCFVQSRLKTETTLVNKNDVDPTILAECTYDKEFPDRVESTTKYDYYRNGQLKIKTDANNYETCYEYDNDQKVTKIAGPAQVNDTLKSWVSYEYDFRGNIKSKKNNKDSKEIITSYDYDILGNMTKK